MKLSHFTFGIILLFACVSCSPKKAEESMKSDSSTTSLVSSSAAIVNKKDSTHKFIRTADLKFKVKSVIKSTYNIEDLTAKQGGFVTYTNLTSNIDEQESDKVSRDSLLVTTRYTVTNTITLRVPNTRLDSTLKEIAKNIDFLDYRIIKADDVALQLLSNNLTINRSAKNETRLSRAITTRGKKLKETTEAEEVLVSKQEQADQARISNLSLKDQMNFSTINLIIYQPQTIKYELISTDKRIKDFEPGFGTKIVDALLNGWDILEAVLVFIINLWGLMLIGGIVFLIYKLYRIKFKK